MMRNPWHHLVVTALVVALVGGSGAVAAAGAAADPAKIVPKGKMTLAWHVGIATRWLDPQEHDGTATPDNFTTAIHDALIMNQGTVLYDHPALAERFEFAQDATSATFWLRQGVKFHNGEPVTPEDVKFTYENYRGAKADVLKGQTERIELIGRVKGNAKLTLAPVLSGSWWLEFPGFQDPKNPFHDKHVREAVSYAIDRRAMNEAEAGGLGKVSGNWINNDVQYAIEWPEFERDLGRAKQLMTEARYPNGFNVDWLTPAPAYYSRGERIIAQLQDIGIRAKLQAMERGVFLQRQQGGLKEWPGLQMILNGARIGGSWANWYEAHFKCGGFNSKDRYCVQELDAKFEQYEKSTNPDERKQLAEEVQRGILENYYLVPVFRHAFVNAIGPRIAAERWQDVFQTITTGYAYPWEDIKLRDKAR